MTNKTSFLFFIFFFNTIALSIAQYNPIISPKKLKKDFSKLVAMVEAHPSPFRHISEENLYSLIDSTKKLLNKPMNKVDFFKLASPIYSTIKDGHSSISIPSDWLKKYKKQHGVFPYKVYLREDNSLFIIDNYSQEEAIALGSEIIAFNDIPLHTFLDKISPYIAYEQEIFRNELIQSNLDLYLLLYFGELEAIKITYQDQSPKSHVVKYIDYGDKMKRLAVADKRRAKKLATNQPFEYNKIGTDVGLIQIYSFALSGASGYEVFLRNTFKKIQKDGVTSLIIDVRGNTGGFPKAVSDLIHYISEKYFKTMAMSEMKVSEAYKSYYLDGTNINPFRSLFLKRRHYIDLNSILRKETGSRVRETSFYNEEPVKQVFEFKGDVYLLIDNRSYSASSSFAATFRCYGLGLLIGEETGGTKIFYANSIGQALTHSGIYARIATTTEFTTCFDEADEGIKPDLLAKPTIPQLVAQQDVALNYALLVIKKRKKLKAKNND